MGFERYDSLREALLVLNAREFFCFFFLLELIFIQKNQHRSFYSLLQSLNANPPQVHHDLTCYHNCRGDQGKESEQDENWGGVYCKGQGLGDGE